MKPADDIKRFFQHAGLSTRPDAHERVFRDMLDARGQATADSPVEPERWRFVMRHPVMKYAVIATIVLATLAILALFHQTSGVSWAIEQSVEALSKCNAMLVEGAASDSSWGWDDSQELVPLRLWAVADPNHVRVERYRWERDGVTMLVTDGRKTWKYEPQANRVTIKNRPYVFSGFWWGAGFLEQLKQARDEGMLTHWEETFGKDPVTGRRQVLLNVAWLEERWNRLQSARLTFDLESKLLVGMKQWGNAEWADPPSILFEKITYCDSLPEEVFEFHIPEGVTVIEE